jgi:heptosyltransferase-2
MKFPRVIVKFPNWIGDAVLASPFVSALRAHWPRAHLAALARTRVRPVALRTPGIDEVVEEPDGFSRGLCALLRRGEYDIAFSLSSTLAAPAAFAVARIPVRIGFTGEWRGTFLTSAIRPLPRSVHQVEHYLALAGAAGVRHPDTGLLGWRMLREDRLEAERFLAECADAGAGAGAGKGLVAFAPGAAYGPAKRWFPRRWAALGDRLALERGCRVVIVGGAGEKAAADEIARIMARPPFMAAGRLSLGGTAALLKRCVTFVSNDSGLMHVGAAAGVPTIGLFASTNPDWTGPYGAAHTAIWNRVACSPCYRRRCLPGRAYACLDSLTVDQVMSALGAGSSDPAAGEREG